MLELACYEAFNTRTARFPQNKVKGVLYSHKNIPEDLYNPKVKWFYFSSGGLASTSNIWNLVKSNSETTSSLVFFENTPPLETAITRKKCLEQILQWSKDWHGDSLFKDKSFMKIENFYSQSFIDLALNDDAPLNSKCLEFSSQKKKLLWLICRALDLYGDVNTVFVWGYIENRTFFEQMISMIGGKHISLFTKPSQYIYSLGNCESENERIYQFFGHYETQLHHCGYLFPRRILDIVCSCQNPKPIFPESHTVQFQINDKSPKTNQLLLKNCQKCWKCKIYDEAMKQIRLECPYFIFGERERAKLKPILPLSTKQKNEKWKFPDVQIEVLRENTTVHLLKWEKQKELKIKSTKTPKVQKGKKKLTQVMSELKEEIIFDEEEDDEDDDLGNLENSNNGTEDEDDDQGEKSGKEGENDSDEEDENGETKSTKDTDDDENLDQITSDFYGDNNDDDEEDIIEEDPDDDEDVDQ